MLNRVSFLSRIFLFVFIFISSLTVFTNQAEAISSISGASSATSSVGVALPITDIQIVGNAASTTPVKLVVTSGTLGITNTGGLSSLSGLTGSTITFTATVEDANEALSTLTYTRGSAGSDTLEVSLVGASEVFFPGNGHLYEYVVSILDWDGANTAAAALTRYGATGYLTTITSEEENDFAAARLGGAGWMGASDVASEGVWRWVTGPENGTHFWSGTGGGNTEGGNYANWATGEPNDSGNEDCAQFLSGGAGDWNDLPCSGFTLPGYVVEFGAPGDMPTVLSKNVSLTTVSSPTVSTLTPADNATNVSVSNNLQITFSQSVTAGTGTVSIYRTSDDSLVESIAVTGPQITGSGTANIVINPTANLDESTGYYVQVGSSAFKNASEVNYAGIANKTTWNFTTGDFTGPVFSGVTVTADRDSAVITWTTNENASTRLVYGLDGVITDTTTETNTTPRVTSHSVSLADLESCGDYSFQMVGVDGSTNNNMATSSVQTFTTEGCSSGGGATKVTNRTVVPATPTTPAQNGATTLKTLWEAKKLNEALSLIVSDFKYAMAEPAVAIEILKTYLNRNGGGVSSTTPALGNSVRDLYLDMTGDDVRMLQELLIAEDSGPAAKELARVTATGFFSSYTKNALGEYQLKNGIVPYTGYFGEITRKQMKQAGLSGLWW